MNLELNETWYCRPGDKPGFLQNEVEDKIKPCAQSGLELNLPRCKILVLNQAWCYLSAGVNPSPVLNQSRC